MKAETILPSSTPHDHEYDNPGLILKVYLVEIKDIKTDECGGALVKTFSATQALSIATQLFSFEVNEAIISIILDPGTLAHSSLGIPLDCDVIETIRAVYQTTVFWTTEVSPKPPFG